MTGHCRHCGLDMLLVSEGDTQEQHACDDWQHRNNHGAEWDDGCCPACAAAERIAKAIGAEAQRTAEAKPDSTWLYGRVDGLHYAVAITKALA